jgi:hypothetical protein
MPLAIELAATWARTISVTEIAQKLGAGLDFLATTLRDTPPRHRSLRAVFDQSWNLLAESEQTLLARLAVFRGGCTERAALIDKSLLRREPIADAALAGSATGDENAARFGMLEPIREYALEQLTVRREAALVRTAHATYYLTLAERAAPELDGQTNQLWLARLVREHENMRVALAWSLQAMELAHAEPQDRVAAAHVSLSDAQFVSAQELGLRLASALSRFWLICGYAHEGRDWLARLLAVPADRVSVPARVRARALQEAAFLAQAQDEFVQASALFAASAALAQEDQQPHDLTALLVNAAMTARNKGAYSAEMVRPASERVQIPWMSEITSCCSGCLTLTRTHFTLLHLPPATARARILTTPSVASLRRYECARRSLDPDCGAPSANPCPPARRGAGVYTGSLPPLRRDANCADRITGNQ